MSATVGTRWHLMSSDDLSSLSNLVSTTCESSESASQTYNPFYNIPPITSAYQTTYKSQFNFPTVFQEIQLQPGATINSCSVSSSSIERIQTNPTASPSDMIVARHTYWKTSGKSDIKREKVFAFTMHK